MAGLRLGPLLRYADGTCATVWVETSGPCTAEVRCADGARGTAGTFRVAGHHYALVPVDGLTPGTATEYEVLLDGASVWPPPDSRFPPSVIATPTDDDGMRVAFGSCRWAAPPAGGKDAVGPDALDTLSARVAADPGGARPDVLLLLGDQVYADEVSDATRHWIAGRRDLDRPPGDQVADYEEYTRLYYESWLDPEVRWLLSTVPSCMIFDDHDVVDDWNTSAAWLADMRATDWWQERLLSGLMSYWVYQQLGNLSPDELAADPLYAAVRETPDGTAALRAFAARADADPTSVRWSYRRDFGRTRLLMVDSRAARVLEEDRRTMLDPGEAAWLREQIMDGRGAYDHLLIGTSLPWLLPHLVHDVEAWNSAICGGERGARWARLGERIRRGADLEHWSAFPSSFTALGDLIAEAGTGPGAPATVSVLSGDVHHAYVAEPSWPGRAPDARVAQLTCSPVHNSVPLSIRLGFRFGWSAPARALGRRIARHGRCAPPTVSWRRTGGPWFGNQIMTLTLRGRSARLRLEQARANRDGTNVLRMITDRELAPPR
ncbi:alkaline phosphatase family protein [Streptomyces sp. KPB2]|uniref:alkaline phosphatase D family protein n=1 Tax=Streptomyces TaxID=1883 RepID=UPI000F6F962B|nr:MULTISPECIES: alkaline phosphatase D family protein [unclassified Streptomyces]WSU03918.1 alkaline phosphatase family protein [Streptomyces sp. NBC_01124]AZM77948.1 alkaline phosphatase family protein [Streptomyces sp. KPB2]MBH5133115.1 alkaline phosphatase family protein [Streptomyces sp. HB-N217]MDU0253679.1 alkaline phosphatase D family protein [Streptomyces sp. PU10]QKW63546.1 alkaline phosphatase family protein [Streptomyces sp. NA03103]